jgi:hypothetical protein
MEKQAKQNHLETDTENDYQEVCRLYEQIHSEGALVRESIIGESYLAAVADSEKFVRALGLDPDDEDIEITYGMLNELPSMLLFAYPGTGKTRSEALQSGLEGWRESKESERTGRILHGSFEIDGGTMSAYMPATTQQERCWTIEYIKDGQNIFSETLEMIYEPVFGPDMGDVQMLNQRIEQIIVERSLE